MKLSLSIVLVVLLILGCRKSEKETIVPENEMTYFNQVKTEFKMDHIQCLLDQWYAQKYKDEPIHLTVIDDEQSYQSFFSCGPNVSLPSIDFTANTLIIGMKADYGDFSNTPVNIRNIKQDLVKNSAGEYNLNVVVTGKPSADLKGAEWFAFTSLVPKTNSAVKLNISYVFN